MSKDVDRNKVFQTIKVRTSLKNDVSWIHKSKEPENERTDQAVEKKPVPVRQNSYVLSTAKLFESLDSPPRPPLQTTKFIASEGNSTNHANGEVIPPQKEAQPEGSTVETKHAIKSQVLTEELIENDEAQPASSTNENPEAVFSFRPADQPIDNAATENKEENADTAVAKSNVEDNEGAAEVSADVHVEKCIENDEAQPVSLTNENPEAVSPVQPAEQPVADTTEENKEKHADATVDQTNIEQNEVKISEDACVEVPVAETCAADGAEESKDNDEDPAALAVEQKPQEEPSTKTEPANATPLEEAGVESTVQPAEKSCEKCPPQPAAEEIVEAVEEVGSKSSLDKSVMINAALGEEEEGTLQDRVEPVPDLLIESVPESPTQPPAEIATEETCETGPPEQAAEETVEAATEVNVESSPETPAVIDAAEETAPLDIVEPVPDLVADTVSELSTQPAAETVVESVECKVESAALAEPVLEAKAEVVVVECEIQPADNTVVEQSVDLTPENAADPVVEQGVKDVVTPLRASDAEAVQDNLAHKAIELTDALDVQPPAAEAAPEPLKDPEQSQTEDTKPNQESDLTNTSEILQMPAEKPQSTQTLPKIRDGKAVCSFCDNTIDGNVKISFSELLVSCHPECLKCGDCAKALGDLLTPIYVHDQVILCDGCFVKTLKT